MRNIHPYNTWGRFTLFSFFLIVLIILFPTSIRAQSGENGLVALGVMGETESLLAEQAKNIIGILDQGEEAVLAKMKEANAQLTAKGLNIALEAIQFYVIADKRPDIRIHQYPWRWVPNDFRRGYRDNIIYIGPFFIPEYLDPNEVAGTIDSAMATWYQGRCLQNVTVQRGPLGLEYDIEYSGWGIGPPGILSLTLIYVFTDAEGPTDINADKYLDTARVVIFYNDLYQWGINPTDPFEIIDIETVSLHEAGHALGIGHFGPPPAAVMNPVYAGIRQDTFPIDEAGICTVWATWPKFD